VALTVSPNVVHGFDFSPEAQGFVLTVDQHVVFSAADVFADLFLQPAVIAMDQDRLMREAYRNLTYSPAGIAAIAYGLGFQDPAYFSRMFKRLAGVTPKQFRERSMASSRLLQHVASRSSFG
jgi:AraC-like DNA-binding protein